MLEEMIDPEAASSLISDLEQLTGEQPYVTAGAIYVLKNLLEPKTADDPKRTVLFDRSFVLPGGFWEWIRDSRRRNGFASAVREIASDSWLWLKGCDSERFRDRCDRSFWRHLVPEVTAGIGAAADHVLNTINEAIINYAEYSFAKRALGRRIHVRLFMTEGNLAYAIIRPSGSRLRQFDPLALRQRSPGSKPQKRGWGHTLMMERALFVSFDAKTRPRGMLIITGLKPTSE